MRAVVPVNLRPPSDEIEFGNRFGLVFLALPVGTRGGLRAAARLKAEMDAIKASPQAMVAFGVLNAWAWPARRSSRSAWHLRPQGHRRHDQRPGAAEAALPRRRTDRELMFWVPQSGRLGLGVSILSYNGHVRLGIAVDAGLVPDPGMIVTHFHQELDDLVRLSRD